MTAPRGGLRAAAIAFGLGLAVAVLSPVAAFAQAARQPVYVGVRACVTCHEGHAAGNQYSKWLLSAHAKAWATLATPEAKVMARLSGLPGDPEKAPVCLGCHATAAETEPWERDPTFRIEDGVQCEKCHGPGSEYMSADVMRDPEKARRAGLRRLTKRDCEVCHYAKSSHAAVHRRPMLDIDAAWQQLAHPVSDRGRSLADTSASPDTSTSASGPRLIGSSACGACHQGEKKGHQYSLWQLGPHARAYASLATPAAERIARQMGVTGLPQTAPECMKCHVTGGGSPAAAAPEFDAREGIGCEACHGAGSDHAASVVADRVGGTRMPAKATESTCLPCHGNAHGKRFVFATARAQIAHPTTPMPDVVAVGRWTALAPQKAASTLDEQYGMAASKGAKWFLEELAVTYKNPVNLAFRPDGREVWVACERSGSVVIVDARTRAKVAEVEVGGQANDVAFSPDGARAYVSSRLTDSVVVVDVAARKVVQTVPVGDEPHGLLTDATGHQLFVANTSSDNISVVDLREGREVRRLAASRSPWSVALSPDGSRLLVSNALSRAVPFRVAPVSEVTALDVPAARVADRHVVAEANLLLGVAWHPSGDFALATLNRTKNLLPMTRILQGWTITNGLAVIWKDGRVDQVLLDEPQRYFADVSDVTFTRDGRQALVTSAGTAHVAIVDVEKLVALIRRTPDADRRDVLPNWLGASSEFIVARVPVKDNPRGVTVSPDGATAWVANTLDDSLSVIDLARPQSPPARVDLGGPAKTTHLRWGERLFHSARITFQRQFSCATCHPDGHVDGLTYDIEADGIGVSPVDNRTLRGIYDTDPFKWEGTNPTLARQCGARLAVFFTRIAPFTAEELQAVNDYTVTIPRPPNRYRSLGAPLNDAQRRGKLIFERTRTNDGRDIPAEGQCAYCHFQPYYTDRQRRDVGSKHATDRQGSFDVPHLNNIYDSAPYLHNGIAATLEEIWTIHNPYDTHGVTNDLTKDQLNDLIEYLKTL
jgi:YVTN family beta-propeller protein